MYWSRVGRPILMSSWTLTDSTTVALKPAAWIWSTTSLISFSSQISPGILLCSAQTISSTPGICLMSLRVMGSLPSPYQRQPIFIDIWCSFCLYSRLRRGEACLASSFRLQTRERVIDFMRRAGHVRPLRGGRCKASPLGEGFKKLSRLQPRAGSCGRHRHRRSRP